MKRIRVLTAVGGVLLLVAIAATPAFADATGNGNGNGNGNGQRNGNGQGNGNGNGNGNTSAQISGVLAATPELDSLLLFGTAIAGGVGYLSLRRRASRH